ncbi:DUF4810 domain-containing protein [Swingsia samuiensis]|uniref:DUF4810 domain-containing protein n=1 Tax=Swingsia samuiensis TaxID=1293412 RepID=A0A4Y6UJA3_9PROT|nr:DUF4810 domain-containing protein [Swingsia samuiensis]QDH17699.1 DUF4810 domain-containing protein [Swingsia samuiensis]
MCAFKYLFFPYFLIAGLVSLTGCSGGERPLYYWGDYQKQLYSYFEKKTSPEEQIIDLEKNIQKAQSKNLSLPPGYYAHLGLLYSETGQYEKAQTAFLTEEKIFPESKTYMDFLLKSSANLPLSTQPSGAKTPSSLKSGS